MTVSIPPDSLTDLALVAAYRTGEEQAPTELVRRHAGPTGRFLYSCGADPGEVEDLVQEAFFRTFRRLDGSRRSVVPELAVYHRG